MGRVRLDETLARCRAIARTTFDAAEPAFSDVEAALLRFDAALATAAEHYAKMNDEKDAELKKAIAPLVIEKRARIHQRFLDLRHAHAQRRKELDEFTIMFFGKTMAGKSTTIEALTAGNGSTIGAGDPDFTRDIKGEPWDGLTLIDTPGLLGFREELHGVAEAYVDRADLICMVVTDDSIEPLLFQRMREVRGQNKHLVVLLNVKAANNPILRGEAEDAFDQREVGELIEFIRERLREVFPGDPAVVIPYCANAAFEAQRAEDEDQRRYLWRESRIDEVIGYIASTIDRRGVPIRATAAFDSLSHYVQSIAEELETDLPALNGQLAELSRKRKEAGRLFDRVMRDSASDLGRLKDHFRHVHEALHELAWEFARGDRTESVKKAFKRACKWDEVEEFQKQFQREVLDRTQRNLEQFRDALGQDLSAAMSLAVAEDADPDFDGVELDSGAWKRKLGKGMRTAGAAVAGAGGMWAGGAVGAEVGAIAGGLIGGPVGLAVGGVIGFLGGVLGGFLGSWGATKVGDVLVDSGLEDQRGAQRDLREKLRDHLWEKYRELNDNLFAWLKAVVTPTQSSVVRMLDEYARAVHAVTKEGGALVRDLHQARHALAHESFDALLRAVHPAFHDGRVTLVDATQWMQYRAKILVQGKERRPIAGLVIGRGGELIRAVREHTGNPIDVIEADAEGLTPRMVVEALSPARIPPTAVEIGTTVRVTISQRDSGAVYGRKQRNLMLAEELLGSRVHVRLQNRIDRGPR